MTTSYLSGLSIARLRHLQAIRDSAKITAATVPDRFSTEGDDL